MVVIRVTGDQADVWGIFSVHLSQAACTHTDILTHHSYLALMVTRHSQAKTRPYQADRQASQKPVRKC